MKTPAEGNYRWYDRGGRRGCLGVPGALFIIALGVLLLLDNQGIIGRNRWWQYLLIAVGVAMLVSAGARYLRSARSQRPPFGRLICGLILIGIGAAFLIGATTLWPLLIIAAGVTILAGALLRRPR
jgi:chromate transport protein ChrA